MLSNRQSAADITENFGRSGILEKSLNRGTVPFFNPVMQGVSKVYRMGEDATANGIKGWVALSTTKKEPLQVLFSSVCVIECVEAMKASR